jgi:hypothetical protein
VSVRRRLEALEGQAQFRRRIPEGSPQAREGMVEHLAQVRRLRRGELDPEEAAEVEAMNALLQRRLASRRGEGRR